MQLSRELIARTAVGILDAYGLADVSMRRVASTLEVAPGALYWHIENKQALIAAMADEITAPVLDVEHEDPKQFCTNLRATLLAHKDGADVVSTAASQPDSHVYPALLDGIRKTFPADLVNGSAEEVEAAAAGLLYLTLGAANMHQAGIQLTGVSTGESTKLQGSEEQVAAAIDLLLSGLTHR